MKRLIACAAIVAALGLSGCSSTDNRFHKEGGVCYRTRIERTLGIQTHKETIAAVPENCTQITVP